MTPSALPFEPHEGFGGLIGLELTELSDELAAGRVVVRDELKQRSGAVHSGVYTSIAESLASLGTGTAVEPEGNMAVGLSSQTSLVRPIENGMINARARRRHRGRTTWVWEIEIRDDDGRLCALTRMTVAVRPWPVDAPAHGRGAPRPSQ